MLRFFNFSITKIFMKHFYSFGKLIRSNGQSFFLIYLDFSNTNLYRKSLFIEHKPLLSLVLRFSEYNSLLKNSLNFK